MDQVIYFPFCTLQVLKNWMLLMLHSSHDDMLYSGTPLNRHPSTADNHNTMDNSERPDPFSIDFNTLETPEYW